MSSQPSSELFQNNNELRRLLILQDINSAKIEKLATELEQQNSVTENLKLSIAASAAAPEKEPKMNAIKSTLSAWGLNAGVAAMVGAAAVMAYQVQDIKPVVKELSTQVNELRVSKAEMAIQISAIKESLDDQRRSIATDSTRISAKLDAIKEKLDSPGKK